MAKEQETKADSTKPAEPGASLLETALGLDLSFEKLYTIDERLRSGSYGTVYTCQHKLHSNHTYAVKIIDRSKLKKRDDDAVFREVKIMKELVHIPAVVRLIDFFETPEKLYMVQVYAAGGDVFDRLCSRQQYTEMDARDLAQTLLKAIHSFHSITPFPIVHRDLKPENLLLLDDRNDSSILVADFGFARHVGEDNMCTTRCGTPAYCAPEIIIGTPYDTKCDLWSIGCLLYMLIGGYPPFKGANHRELFRKVRASDFVFHEANWGAVSVPAKRLISSLLCVNPAVRWDAATALQCDWFQKTDRDSLRSTDLSSSLSELRKFRPKRTWKSTMQALRFAATAPFWNTDGVSFAKQMNDWDNAASGGVNSVASTVSSVMATSGLASPMSTVPKPKKDFKSVYELKHKLRKGSFATVWACEHRETKKVFAVKVVMREGLDPQDDEAVLKEVSMMQCIGKNKYVVELVDFFEESDYFYLVMEHMAGGDVFDRIVQTKFYTEKNARDLVTILLKAAGSLHKLHIAHRDIKPQNLLLVSPDDHADIKLGDFGFARRVHTPESLTSRVGTPSYVAPEILKNVPHDERVDLWSIGVVTYVLLVGYPPFMEEDQSTLFRKIRNGEWEFYEQDWLHISQEAKDFISGLLVTNPKERWSIEECLRSEWLRRDPHQLSSVSLSGSFRAIKMQKNRLRSVARAILWLGSGAPGEKDGDDSKSNEPPTKEIATQAQVFVSETSSSFD